MSHFFKVGDVLKSRVDGTMFVVLSCGKGQDVYCVNILTDGLGQPYNDEFLDVETYMNPDNFTMATELEKALL